jgi:O-antigen/teichoic acid export membrane protein
MFWSFCERMGHQGIQLVVWVIMARLLLPEEFGLVAMLVLFMAVAQAFTDSGFGNALIQKKNATHVDSCSIFYFNILVGLIGTGLLCLAAPWIASFYGQPVLKPLTYMMSLCIVISSFGLIPAVLLTKNIDFQTQTKVRVISGILSGAIGVGLALKNFGVWSLAMQQVCSRLFHTILLWAFSSWRPSLVFSLKSLREMFPFGSRLLASGLLNNVFEHIYLVVIGKLFSPADVAFYSNATRAVEFPTSNLSLVASRVTFPVFAAVQDDLARLKRGARKATRSLVFLNFPMMIGLAVVAKPLVYLLLTEKWAPCIPYLQLLCVVGVLYPLQVTNLTILKAKGRSDLFFRLEIAKKMLVAVAIVVTYRWGITAMIWGQIVTSCLGLFLNSHYAGKLIGYPPTEQMLDALPYLGAATIMGVGAHFVGFIPLSGDWSLLIGRILTGSVIYIALNWIFRTSAFLDIVNILRARFGLRRASLLSMQE